MKILAVTNMYPTKLSPSSGTFIKQQVDSLIKEGLNVKVIHIERDNKGLIEYFRMFFHLKIKVKNYNPDIIHCMYGGFMSYLVCKVISQKKIIVSYCGADLLGEPSTNIFKRFSIFFGVYFSRLSSKRAHKIIVKSKNLYDALPKSIDFKKVSIIPNGIDLNKFYPRNKKQCQANLNWDSKYFNILFPSTSGNRKVNLRKQLWLAEEACEILKKNDIPFKLHKLEGIPHNEVPERINASDCVLLTSKSEGSPNIIKEAMACNTPVVSVDVGDVNERLNSIDNSFICEMNSNDISNKLSIVYANNRPSNGTNYIQELSASKIAKKIEKIYLSLI